MGCGSSGVRVAISAKSFRDGQRCRVADTFAATAKRRFVLAADTAVIVAISRPARRAPRRKESSPRADDVETIGWFDQEYAYLLPDAARRRVATFVRESGETWACRAHALHKSLVRKGIVVPGPDGRPGMQVRVGDGKRRVLRLRFTALRGGPVPGVSPVSDESETPEDTEALSPASPISEDRYLRRRRAYVASATWRCSRQGSCGHTVRR